MKFFLCHENDFSRFPPQRDRSHTSKCASCKAALANIQRLRLWLGILAVVTTIVNPSIALLLGENAIAGSFLLTLNLT